MDRCSTSLLAFVGAVIGGYVMGALGFATAGGTIYTILVAILGACILVALVRLITGRRGAAV